MGSKSGSACTSFERVDRAEQLARSFVAPSQRQPDVDVVRHEVGAPLQRIECLLPTVEFAERFTQQVATASVGMHKLATALERGQGVCWHAQLKITFGFAKGSF